jgi:outer membrane receptor protein involved in Fe transport
MFPEAVSISTRTTGAVTPLAPMGEIMTPGTATVTVRAPEAVEEIESVTVTVKDETPADTGIPDNAPVDASRENPAGIAPDVTVKE